MAIQIEPTNKCNTNCVFCPRHKTPATGYMETATFHNIIERIEESNIIPEKIGFGGLGEPLLHKNIVDFISNLSRKDHMVSITTNAFLLTPALSQKIIESGLQKICISMSGIDDLYEVIHKLDFSVVNSNIESFLKYAKNETTIWISIVECDQNESHIDELKKYWNSKGINSIIVFEEISRGGAHNNKKDFIYTNQYKAKVDALLASNNIKPICFQPFLETYIAWDGRYHMCGHDYEKRYPLGSVFENTFEEIKSKAQEFYEKGLPLCRVCDCNPVNVLREILIKIDNGRANEKDLNSQLEIMQKTSRIVYGNR